MIPRSVLESLTNSSDPPILEPGRKSLAWYKWSRLRWDCLSLYQSSPRLERDAILLRTIVSKDDVLSLCLVGEKRRVSLRTSAGRRQLDNSTGFRYLGTPNVAARYVRIRSHSRHPRITTSECLWKLVSRICDPDLTRFQLI
jgi:hypothetical protein